MTRRHRLSSQDFPARLREQREAAGLTQQQLAERAGYRTGQAISLLENGRTGPTTAAVAQLAEALGVSAVWLGYGTEGGGAGEVTGWGARLRAARQAAGLSQRTLADETGLASNASIVMLEKEAGGLDLALSERLAQALGVSATWLAFGVDE